LQASSRIPTQLDRKREEVLTAGLIKNQLREREERKRCNFENEIASRVRIEIMVVTKQKDQ
jgi:hypothetical protein